MLSFSVPPFTVPVLPACRTTVSLPRVAGDGAQAPVPVKMLSSPASPTMVPGPVSPDWLRVSFPARAGDVVCHAALPAGFSAK